MENLEGQFITTDVDGVEVVGQITFHHPKELNITICRPYNNGAKSGTHLPYAMPRVFTPELVQQKGKELLEEIYQSCQILEKNSEEISRCLPRYYKWQLELKEEMKTLRSQMATLRQQFKAGQFTQQEYQKELHPLHEMMSNLDIRFSNAFRDVMHDLVAGCRLDNLTETAERMAKSH